ncbi:uncharacterized protein BO87DRAFT_426155 [Aspergillus neoniger CBS 115656]|uniref:Uncharacterized protein n=1 Tax=Aspergillus neoniger (strain CBS 115656) TaxID=1448310 RepID=A0A318YJA7_ASPNB|nr:hypothetical protein BO87DRAFT_426155 [Aspergillus neoniger CBS 115656]PYH34389.1 hypothetical protein BO87DRAFT_426155 [Aspergillus neoniger CBS 115656]
MGLGSGHVPLRTAARWVATRNTGGKFAVHQKQKARSSANWRENYYPSSSIRCTLLRLLPTSDALNPLGLYFASSNICTVKLLLHWDLMSVQAFISGTSGNFRLGDIHDELLYFCFALNSLLIFSFILISITHLLPAFADAKKDTRRTP